jgi:hypothetical protein
MGRDPELTSLPDSWGAMFWTLDKQWATSPPSTDVFALYLDKHPRHEMPWPGALGRAHNPEVTGSNPVPATKKTQVRKGSAECGPFSSPKVRTNSNTRPHGEDASSFVDIADEQIRDHANEELNSGPQPSSLNAEAAGATPWGASPPSEVGNWCSITGLTCGDGTRRSSGKPIVSWSDLVIGRRPRSGIRIRSSRWGSAPFRLGIGGLRRVLPTIPTNPPQGDIFRRRGCGGSRGCSNHVSIDSSRGRFA